MISRSQKPLLRQLGQVLDADLLKMIKKETKKRIIKQGTEWTKEHDLELEKFLQELKK
jgi:hypothetical protein